MGVKIIVKVEGGRYLKRYPFHMDTTIGYPYYTTTSYPYEAQIYDDKLAATYALTNAQKISNTTTGSIEEVKG